MIAIASTVVALALCHLLARERFGRATSLLAVAGVGLGSPVLWLLAGPVETGAAVRLVAGALAAYGWVRSARGASTPSWGRAAAGVVAGFLATMPWTGGPIGGGFDLVDLLWSSRGGLLATSPAVYVGVLGFVALWRADRAIAAAGVALLAATAVLVSSRAAWWTGAWPSPAAFLGLTPYVVCGVAAAIEASARLVARRPVLAAGSLLSVLVLWNVTLMNVAQNGQYHLGEPASFGDVGAAQARALHGWIGHPPSAPANAIFAVANGVRPGDYDVLAPNRLLAGGDRTGRVDIGSGDGAFVGEGWHVAEQDGGTSFRWATRSASVDVPLARAADLVVQVDARPYQPPNRPPQQLTLVVNGVPHGPVTLASGWHPAVVTVPSAAWRSGVNHLELRFAYDARPSDAGIPDGRALSASIDAIAVRVAP
jgi:hypothetical protein